MLLQTLEEDIYVLHEIQEELEHGIAARFISLRTQPRIGRARKNQKFFNSRKALSKSAACGSTLSSSTFE